MHFSKSLQGSKSTKAGFIRSGKVKGASVFFSLVRESQGIGNVVRENHSMIITLVKEKRIVTQWPVSIDQVKATQAVSCFIKHLSSKYLCSYYLFFSLNFPFPIVWAAKSCKWSLHGRKCPTFEKLSYIFINYPNFGWSVLTRVPCIYPKFLL